MGYSPITPFRRAVDAALLERHRRQAGDTALPQGLNKWEVLREIGVARKLLGLSDRDVTVLQALLTFHPQTNLGESADLVVHASNEAICARLNGMPCSTMRRHLAALVGAGILTRRDSPNGKRYARQTKFGKVAYGFDLSPLVQRHAEICALAESLRDEAELLACLRETISLMRRDLAALALWGAETRSELSLWTRLQDFAALSARALRRKLDIPELRAMQANLERALQEARDILEPDALDMSSRDAQNEQHLQNSDKDLNESEAQTEICEVVEVASVYAKQSPKLPLNMVLSACPDIVSYAESKPEHWHQFVRAADRVRPMMGIAPDAWAQARHVLGAEQAAMVLAAMLQRFGELKSPGGYLRTLVRKAQEGLFSPGPMIMALLRAKQPAAGLGLHHASRNAG